jgi:sulfopyruvate decarboxylase TPP-binding subunit
MAAKPPLTARRFLEEVKACGFTHVVWLPDSESGHLYEALRGNPALTLVPVAREGEAIPIALGLLIGGKEPLVLMQSTGFFEQGDSLRGLAIDLALPLVLCIGYRGWTREGSLTDSAAIYLEPVLQAWGLPYYLLETDDDVGVVRKALVEARERPGPVAVLIGNEYEA